MVKFNSEGLWFYEHISFSKYGTLKNSLIEFISNSTAGMTHKELKTLLRIQVQNSLTHLIQIKSLQRRLLSKKVFVYLSDDESRAHEQWQKRLELNGKSLGVSLPSETIVIDVLLEVIRGNDFKIDEAVLGSRLEQRGIPIQQQQLIYVLTYFDIKKNGS